MNVQIVARQATCIGSGQCVFTDPDAFDQDDDGLVLVLKQPAAEGEIALARQAVNICPSRSLSILEAS